MLASGVVVDLLSHPSNMKIWSNIHKFRTPPPPPPLSSFLCVFWTVTVMQEYTQHLHNDHSCVHIDSHYFAEGTEAESTSSSSHVMHQNNWQYPIILWSVYRRSDELPENESVIRKPPVWITDVTLAGQNVCIKRASATVRMAKIWKNDGQLFPYSF